MIESQKNGPGEYVLTAEEDIYNDLGVNTNKNSDEKFELSK